MWCGRHKFGVFMFQFVCDCNPPLPVCSFSAGLHAERKGTLFWIGFIVWPLGGSMGLSVSALADLATNDGDLAVPR